MQSKRYILNNGLTLWLTQHPDDKLCINIAVRYGELDEVPNAHLLEHIIYRRMRKDLHICGLEFPDLSMDASTYLDYMNFEINIPKDNTKDTLESLACILNSDLVDEEETEWSKKDVFNEVVYRSTNLEELLNFNLSHVLFGRRIPEETEARIKSIRTKNLINSKRKYIQGSNLIISIAGNLDEALLLKHVKKTVGKLSEGKRFEHNIKPNLGYEKEKVMYLPGIKSSALSVYIPIKGHSHKDTLALEFLLGVLEGNNEGYEDFSRLGKEIKYKQGLAYLTESFLYACRNAGIMELRAVGMLEENAYRIQNIIISELSRLRTELVPKKEFENVREDLLITHKEDTESGTNAITNHLIECELYNLNPDLGYHEQELAELNPKRIMDVARRYFRRDRYRILTILPEDQRPKYKLRLVA